MATSSYQINFKNKYLVGDIATNPSVVLPYDKQTPIHLAWLNSLVQPVQRLNDLQFQFYDFGSTYSFYSASTTYSIGARINGGLSYNNAVFESIVASSSGTFSLTKWQQILPTFIGFEERKKYMDSRVIFEYALNRFFRTTFRQPNFADTSKSDIYISDNTPSLIPFYMGPTDVTSTNMSPTASYLYGLGSPLTGMASGDGFYLSNGNFVINITATAYNGLPGYTGATGSADSVIRNFADQINYCGMVYTIKRY